MLSYPRQEIVVDIASKKTNQLEIISEQKDILYQLSLMHILTSSSILFKCLLRWLQSKHIRSSSTHKHHVSTSATFTPDGYITPAGLNYHYNITTNKGHSRAIQGVFASHGQHYSPADIKSFQAKFNLSDQPVYKSLGQHNNSAQWCSANIDYCGEGDLDLEYMMAVSQSVTNYILLH